MKAWARAHWEALICWFCGAMLGIGIYLMRNGDEWNDPETWVFFAIMFVALFLLWSGRESSPKHQRRMAHIDDLFQQAQTELAKKGLQAQPPPGRKDDA